MCYFYAKYISKSYGDKLIIKDISLEARQGERVALLGESSIGKTILFHILSGLESPDKGDVFLDGQKITGKTGYFGYMQQKDLMLPYKKMIDNLALPLILKKIPKKQAYSEVKKFLLLFGLEGTEQKYPHQLSGGMRQRAAFLRSYLFCQEHMLLDEPFSALDAMTKRQMHEWYRKISKQMNTTSIFITHDIDEAILLADTVYIMSGRPGEITAKFDLCACKEERSVLSVDAFTISDAFIAYKKEILQAISF